MAMRGIRIVVHQRMKVNEAGDAGADAGDENEIVVRHRAQHFTDFASVDLGHLLRVAPGWHSEFDQAGHQGQNLRFVARCGLANFDRRLFHRQ